MCVHLPRCRLASTSHRATLRATGCGVKQKKKGTKGERAKTKGSLLVVRRERVRSTDVSPNLGIVLLGRLAKTGSKPGNNPDQLPLPVWEASEAKRDVR